MDYSYCYYDIHAQREKEQAREYDASDARVICIYIQPSQPRELVSVRYVDK